MEPPSDDRIPAHQRSSTLPDRARTVWDRLQRTWALGTWNDLQRLGFVRTSLEFAGLFLLSFVPFLLLVAAALGSNLPRGFATRADFSPAATHDVTSLFARSGNGSARAPSRPRPRPTGPIGTVMTLMEAVVALGLAIHLGAYAGAKWVQWPVTRPPLEELGLT